MAELHLWCRVRIVGPGGAPVAGAVLLGRRPPDLRAVDRVARLVLEARRAGATVELSHVCTELAGLLELAGLSDLAGLRVQRRAVMPRDGGR